MPSTENDRPAGVVPTVTWTVLVWKFALTLSGAVMATVVAALFALATLPVQLVKA